MDDDQGLDAPRAQPALSTEETETALHLHRRAKQAFLELIEQPETERAAVLERICQGDQALHAEVASLLAHHRHESLLLRGMRKMASEPQDGSMLCFRPASPVGKEIGGILVECEVGAGGMSAVYKGYDARLRRRVAIKALHGRSEFDKETRSRFLREARVLSRLKHPNICEIYGYEETSEGDYLILEYIDGRNLREVLMTALPLRERDRIAVTLAEVLQIAHSAGVVHRDLKPENVMLTHDGQLKVLDFGIARMEGWDEIPPSAAPDVAFLDASPLTRTGGILGTPHYMSPEQARGEPTSPASDIFSLGLVLYELYLGRSAYPDDLASPALLDRVQRGLVGPARGLSRNRRRLVQRMLSIEASSRPTVTEVVQVLRQIRDSWRRFVRRSVAVALLCMVVLMGAKYVLDITRAVMQAEAARSQIALINDMFGDTLFNKLGLRDRQVMSEQFWYLMLAALQDLPDRLLRESVVRFTQRILGLARIRLSAGDTLGAQAAFARALVLDELTVAPLDNTELRRKLVAVFKPLGTAGEGRAEVRSALASYKRAVAFYDYQLARGRDSERWRLRLALVSMPLGWTCLQSGDFPAARSTFERAEQLLRELLRESSGPKRRQWNLHLAEVMRALAETGYYAGNLDWALAKAQDSIHIYEALVEEMPFLPDMQANLGEAYFMLGRVLQAQLDTQAAWSAFSKARAILTALHKEDPGHCRQSTLLALDHLAIARLSRQRGEPSFAQDALQQAAELTAGVTTESLFIAQDARAQTLLELGRVQDARPFVESLTALGWQNDLTHQDFTKLYKAQQG